MSMLTPCPVCGDDRPELYLDGDDREISLDSVGSSRTVLSHGRILRCTRCGLGYRSFRPREDQLAALYRAADDSMYEAEMPNRWRTAHRHKRIVDSYVPIKGTLLDVGCASGAFLSVMEQAGWEVEGVEPSASHHSVGCTGTCNRTGRIPKRGSFSPERSRIFGAECSANGQPAGPGTRLTLAYPFGRTSLLLHHT
jgi:hypothetical protein